MAPKTNVDDNTMLLWLCLQNSDYKKIDWTAVGLALNGSKPNAASMRFARLKAKIEASSGDSAGTGAAAAAGSNGDADNDNTTTTNTTQPEDGIEEESKATKGAAKQIKRKAAAGTKGRKKVTPAVDDAAGDGADKPATKKRAPRKKKALSENVVDEQESEKEESVAKKQKVNDQNEDEEEAA